MSAPPLRAPGDVLVHLRRARDHIDRHDADRLDLASLAAVAGISRYHFQRLFTATYGLSPAAHLSQRRVERAQDLLRATNLTATEVCPWSASPAWGAGPSLVT
jgi:AraC-like DNA-binding protein